MTPRTRFTLIYGTAAATLLAAIFAPPKEEPVQPVRVDATASDHHEVMPGDKMPSSATATQSLPEQGFMPHKRNGLEGEPGNLFQADRPPAPPEVAPHVAKPPAPVAPPLPYTYMGKMIEGGELTVFLTRQDKPYVVHVGDVLDGMYRVDAIRPPFVELTYLPLDKKQTLNIGVSK